MNLTIYTGIGNIYNSPLYIKDSYGEATLALESSFMDTKETFIVYRHTVSDISRVLLCTRQHMDLIENCLLKNDLQKLTSLLERYFEILHEENVSSITAKALCINLIIHIYDIVNENSVHEQPVLSSLLPLAFLESFDDFIHEQSGLIDSGSCRGISYVAFQYMPVFSSSNRHYHTDIYYSASYAVGL